MKTLRRPQGFTFIELLVALVILAMLTAAASINFVGPLRKQKLKDEIDSLRQFDADARNAAIARGQSVRLIVDVTNHSMSRFDGQDVQELRSRILVPSLSQVRVGETTFKTGPADIDISIAGYSRSYSLVVGDYWISFAGLSGVSVVEDHAPDSQSSRLH